MNPKRDLIMSVNVPFCPQICDFCDKHIAPSDEATRNAYYKALLAELDSVTEELDEYRLKCLYLGGGVPTYLAQMQLPQLVRAITKRVDLADDFSIDIKTAPGCIGINVLSKLKDCGAVRMEFDLCSSHPFELEVLGRPYTEGDLAVSRTILEYGKVDNFGINVMYGLPGQTSSSMQSTLETAWAFAPTSMALLPLRATRGTKFWRRVVAERGASIGLVHHRHFPERAQILTCFSAADAWLAGVGFVPYTARHYALPGHESRRQLLLLSSTERMELGVGGHSICGGYELRNTSDLNRYIRGAGDPGAILEKAEPLDSATHTRMLVRAGLFGAEGFNLAACPESGACLDNAAGRESGASIRETLDSLAEEGLVVIEAGERAKLTLAGRCFADEVFARFAHIEGKA